MVEASKTVEKEFYIVVSGLRLPQKSVTRVNLTFKHEEDTKKVQLKQSAELVLPVNGKMSNLLLKFTCTGEDSAFSRQILLPLASLVPLMQLGTTYRQRIAVKGGIFQGTLGVSDNVNDDTDMSCDVYGQLREVQQKKEVEKQPQQEKKSFEFHSELFGGPDYTCTGVMDEDAQEAYQKWINQLQEVQESDKYVQKYKEMIKKQCIRVSVSRKKFDDLVEIEKKIIGGSFEKKRAWVLTALVHRVIDKPREGRKCLIYFHGGHLIAGSAEDYKQIANRYAVECDCTVFSVNYRLSPDYKAPSAVFDGYEWLLWVLENAEDMGIDTDHIAICGDDAGGWITAGISLVLAARAESHKIKFQLQMVPMFFNPGQEQEAGVKDTMEKVIELAMKNDKDKLFSTHESFVFPTRADSGQVKFMPPAVILTTEFDQNRKVTEEAAALYHTNGKLLDFCVIPGTYHSSYLNYSLSKSDLWFASVAKIVNQYL